jgi:hypothetical protein
MTSRSANKPDPLAWAAAGLIILLACTTFYFWQRYAALASQTKHRDSVAFHDQFYEGKACGLLTNKEAANILGTKIVTNATVISAEGVTAASRSGSPRVDSCTHTAGKSSEGYIDIVLKTYESKAAAAKYYAEELAKTFTDEPRQPEGLGQRLAYGAGAFYLLKDRLVIEVSASQTPRVSEPGNEAFARGILEKVAAKL